MISLHQYMKVKSYLKDKNNMQTLIEENEHIPMKEPYILTFLLLALTCFVEHPEFVFKYFMENADENDWRWMFIIIIPSVCVYMRAYTYFDKEFLNVVSKRFLLSKFIEQLIREGSQNVQNKPSDKVQNYPSDNAERLTAFMDSGFVKILSFFFKHVSSKIMLAYTVFEIVRAKSFNPSDWVQELGDKLQEISEYLGKNLSPVAVASHLLNVSSKVTDASGGGSGGQVTKVEVNDQIEDWLRKCFEQMAMHFACLIYDTWRNETLMIGVMFTTCVLYWTLGTTLQKRKAVEIEINTVMYIGWFFSLVIFLLWGKTRERYIVHLVITTMAHVICVSRYTVHEPATHYSVKERISNMLFVNFVVYVEMYTLMTFLRLAYSNRFK